MTEISFILAMPLLITHLCDWPIFYYFQFEVGVVFIGIMLGNYLSDSAQWVPVHMFEKLQSNYRIFLSIDISKVILVLHNLKKKIDYLTSNPSWTWQSCWRIRSSFLIWFFVYFLINSQTFQVLFCALEKPTNRKQSTNLTWSSEPQVNRLNWRNLCCHNIKLQFSSFLG